nr:hypothetical protein [uncultured Fusobacterium sp.]
MLVCESISYKFEQERDGKLIRRDISAHFCSNKYPSSIETVRLQDVCEGDVLIHTKSKKRCYIIDVVYLPNGVIAKYETDFQRARYQKQNIGNISIGSIGGSSIIGNKQYASLDNSSIQNLKDIISNKNEDKELLEKLLNRIEAIIEDNQPVSKGTFSKFNNIFKKYPDILNATGNLLLKWLSSTL